MIYPRNNAWRHGPARFEHRFPIWMEGLDGIFPMRAVLDLEIGSEVVLFIRDVTPFVKTLARLKATKLRIHGGVGRNEFGCLGFLLFWIPSPFAERIPLVVYEKYINVHDEEHIGPWMDLAYQTHWHLFVVDQKNEQRNFFEFKNTFNLSAFIESFRLFCDGIPVVDFDKAKAKFMEEHSLDDLFAASPTSTTLRDDGLSIYDPTLALASAPENVNPFRTARFLKTRAESLKRHSPGKSLPTVDYLTSRLEALREEASQKAILYLDVCHWIDLSHVWLESGRPSPIYKDILRSMFRLLERNAILCPLSITIFDELMKQTDPRSRGATANLMEVFSQGTSLIRYEDAFALQCKSALGVCDVHSNTRPAGLSRIGLWFRDGLVREAWYAGEPADMWERMSIDLRWDLTVWDCQQLASLFGSPHPQGREFFSKWAGLAPQQRVSRRPYKELARECRMDIASEYKMEVVPNLAEVLSNTWADNFEAAVLEAVGSTAYGRIPCVEILGSMCAAHVYRGSKVRMNDILDFYHASLGIPASAGYFCDGPMEHLLRSKVLGLDGTFNAEIRSKPEELLEYLLRLEDEYGQGTQ